MKSDAPKFKIGDIIIPNNDSGLMLFHVRIITDIVDGKYFYDVCWDSGKQEKGWFDDYSRVDLKFHLLRNAANIWRGLNEK